jgi:glycine cleavage system H protein
MAEYLYSQDHEWIRALDEERVQVGISDFAQSELGEIAFVELPEIGRRVRRGEAVCSIDSLKSTSEIYAPVSGTIVEINDSLPDESRCGLINSDPLGAGWLFMIRMSSPEELKGLLSASEYEDYIRL